MHPRKKLLVVDDHALVRESLLLLLDHRLPGLVLRDAGSLAQALRMLAGEPDIDLVLLDLDLPDSRGPATLAAVRAAVPALPVVVLSAHDSRDNVLAVIDQGAAGFVSKSVDAQALVAAVQRVVEGGVVVPAEALDTLAVGHESVEGGLAALDLTDRQRDVLALLIAGMPDKLICRQLSLSHATVKTHLQALFRKLGVSSRTQAVLAVARMGALV